MAELNKIQFLLFVFLMTFPVHGLDVFLSNARSDFKQQYEINTQINITNGEKIYDGTLNQFTYQAQPSTSKVIVHISSKSRFVEIIRPAVREIRLQIAQELGQWHFELVFLGIENFDDDEYHLISAFIIGRIRRDQSQIYFAIETIGENRFDRLYQYDVVSFATYQENAQICGGTLLARLRSIPHGALRPSGSNDKKIKFYEYTPKMREVTWSVDVENNVYVPNVNVSHEKYNLKIRHPNEKIHLVILSGMEYSAATSIRSNSPKMTQIWPFLNEMAKNGDVLIILGAFNFDWTEVDIVTQIIFQHSDGWQNTDFNFFAYGFGMFNTMYLFVYENHRIFLLKHPNSSVSQIMKILIDEEVKERSINVYYCDIEWDILKAPIYLANGRYFPGERFQNFSFPMANHKMAFIVYDLAEINDQADFVIVCQSVAKLKQNGIYVFMIEAINFGLNDMHIIAEWIDWFRGDIHPEQISVLGAGTFDTIFQSELTTYNSFLYEKNELQTIRNAYVNSANTKSVIAGKIDNPTQFWLYSINTLNGFYEPDLISDINMFDTGGRKRLCFIITSASNFLQISTVSVQNRTKTSSFVDKIEEKYPKSEWSVYLVGLDNFGERDSHLFGELVKAHTYDPRPLGEFVLTFHPGPNQTKYRYKDIPFAIESGMRKQALLTGFIGWACGPAHGFTFH